MKLFLKALIGVVAVLAVTLVILRVTGLNPRGPRPGLWLSGNRVIVPVADWSFANRYPTIEVQTKTWYFVPHSVTIFCVSYQKQLYLQALGRNWSGNVVRDPRVRIKIGDQLYDGTAVYVTDPNEFFGVDASMAQKYRGPPYKEFVPNVFFRVGQQCNCRLTREPKLQLDNNLLSVRKFGIRSSCMMADSQLSTKRTKSKIPN